MDQNNIVFQIAVWLVPLVIAIVLAQRAQPDIAIDEHRQQPERIPPAHFSASLKCLRHSAT